MAKRKPETPESRPRARYALLTEYDGSLFHGWQRQKNAVTVQQLLEEAWFDLVGQDVRFTGSSRTDAGVHAAGHVCHFDSYNPIPLANVPLALNSRLPAGIAVHDCRETAPDFDARFQAVGKRYRYRVAHGSIKPALRRNFAAHLAGPVDDDAMREAARLIAGERDFVAFMDQGSVVRRTVRSVPVIRLTASPDARRGRYPGRELVFDIVGDGFLYHMVRIIVGTIIAVGQGKITTAELPELIAAGDRTRLGKTMPPEGLELVKVFYRDELFGDDSAADYATTVRTML